MVGGAVTSLRESENNNRFFFINLSWNLHDKISVNKKVRAQLETADTKLVSKLNLIAPNGNVIATGKTEHLA